MYCVCVSVVECFLQFSSIPHMLMYNDHCIERAVLDCVYPLGKRALFHSEIYLFLGMSFSAVNHLVFGHVHTQSSLTWNALQLILG